MKQSRYRNYLKLYRKRRGLTQREVARILGLASTGMISRWEHGVLLPETINALKMAVIYKTQVDAIYEELRTVLQDELDPRVEDVVRGADGERDE